MVFIAISMEPSMKVNGKKINNTVWVSRLGQMEPNTMVNMSKARSTARAHSPGLTDLPTTENSLKTIFKDLANITGPMVESTTAHG